MTTLNAQRFADDPQLTAAINDTTNSHVVFDGGGTLPRASGPHVRRLQESLLAMGYPLPQFGADGDFGTETTVAVTMFQIEAGVQPRPDLPDRTELIDGKVGRDTMVLFDMFDPGPTSGAFTDVATGVAPVSVTFAEAPEERFAGFDASSTPRSLVVGTGTRRRVQVLLDPVDAEVQYVADDPAIAAVALTPDGIVVTGSTAGRTLLRARFAGQEFAVLDVVVKDAREETVNFFFVMDSANPAHASNRLTTQAGALTSRLNRVWRRQANVQFTLGQFTEVVVPVALGDVVQVRDLHHFVDFAVPGQLNVFFVWEFEPVELLEIPGFVIRDSDGTTAIHPDPAVPIRVFVDDDDCPDLLTVAHEAGHYLGFHSNDHPPNGILSVCAVGVDRPRVLRQVADLVNP